MAGVVEAGFGDVLDAGVVRSTLLEAEVSLEGDGETVDVVLLVGVGVVITPTNVRGVGVDSGRTSSQSVATPRNATSKAMVERRMLRSNALTSTRPKRRGCRRARSARSGPRSTGFG